MSESDVMLIAGWNSPVMLRRYLGGNPPPAEPPVREPETVADVLADSPPRHV